MRRFLALLLLCLVLGCAEHIPRAELRDQLGSASPPDLVDVRSRAEYEESHVPGAVWVPFYAVLGGSEELPVSDDPEEPLVVYCEHGPRAGIARAQLWFMTDRPIRFLEGHMTAWKEEGLPVASVQPEEDQE